MEHLEYGGSQGSQLSSLSPTVTGLDWDADVDNEPLCKEALGDVGLKVFVPVGMGLLPG